MLSLRCAIRLVPPIAAEGDEVIGNRTGRTRIQPGAWQVETLISERSPTSTMRQTAALRSQLRPRCHDERMRFGSARSTSAV